MNQLNQQKTALTVATFLAGWHILWLLLVAVGAGQVIWDFIMWAHMVHMPVTVGPFDISASLALIVLTFVVGYIFGYVFAYMWNRLHQETIIIS